MNNKTELPSVESQSHNNSSILSYTRRTRSPPYPHSCSNGVWNKGLFQSLHSDRKPVHSSNHILHRSRSNPKI